MIYERETAYCWYPFLPESRCLTIGPGICPESGRAEKLPTEGEYDYIILNRALSRAWNYVGAEPGDVKAAGKLLDQAQKLLAEEGHLLILEENRLGLCHFAGVAEEDSGIYFEGLNHYPDWRESRQFTRGELAELLRQQGWAQTEWFYPYPNLCAPTEIFTEEAFLPYGYGRDYCDYGRSRIALFQEGLVARDLVRESGMPALANAFLIDAYRKGNPSGIIYVKINCDRGERYQISTMIRRQADDTVTVCKRALRPEAIEHLKQMHTYEERHAKGTCAALAGEWTGDGIVYPFLGGGSLEEKVEPAILSGSPEAFLDEFRDVVGRLYPRTSCMTEIYTQDFCRVFGEERADHPWECVQGGNVDLILGNIFPKEAGYCLIDNEWIFDFWIPLPFILWRSLNDLLLNHPGIADVTDAQTLYREFAIDAGDIPLFHRWHQHFTWEYVGAGRLLGDNCLPRSCAVATENLAACATLYPDYGEGYAQENAIEAKMLVHDGDFSCTFELPGDRVVKKLRFDPLEGGVCRCRAQLETSRGGVALSPVNAAFSTVDWAQFHTPDPQYEIDVNALEGSRIVISGRLHVMDSGELTGIVCRQADELRESKGGLARKVWRLLKKW